MIITMRVELLPLIGPQFFATLAVWLHDENHTDCGDEDVYIEGGPADGPNDALDRLLHNIKILLSEPIRVHTRYMVQQLDRKPYSYAVAKIDVPLYQ